MSKYSPEKLGAMVEVLRARYKWSQQLLADKTGLSRNRIAQIERGEAKDVKLSTLIVIFEQFGMAVKIGLKENKK